MYTGWMRDFPLNRLLSAQEKASHLDREVVQSVEPDERACLVHFNSTYIDMIDRRFRLRGMVSTTIVALGTLVLILLGIFLLFKLVVPNLKGDVWDFVMYAIVGVCIIGAPVLFWYATLRYEFFTYRWYPARFNRKTRKVYFFTGGEEGAFSIAWDDAFFYIGGGSSDVILKDLRLSVIEDRLIKRSFAIGHYFDDEAKIRAIWEFIRQYMERGPEAAVVGIHDGQMNLSVSPSWRNCYLFVVASLGPSLLANRFLLLPVLLPLVLCRWLVLNSCREPVWPKWVEDECEVDLHDPLRLVGPEVIAQFQPDRRAL